MNDCSVESLPQLPVGGKPSPFAPSTPTPNTILYVRLRTDEWPAEVL